MVRHRADCYDAGRSAGEKGLGEVVRPPSDSESLPASVLGATKPRDSAWFPPTGVLNAGCPMRGRRLLREYSRGDEVRIRQRSHSKLAYTERLGGVPRARTTAPR